jgi:membrane protease YdiL (CAAX protease family)
VSEPYPPVEDRPLPPRPRRRWTGHAAKVVRPVLVDRVERDHRQSDAEFRRRRGVVAITMLVGATLLGLSFSTAPGEQAFYPLTIGLAATWVIGSLVSGPLHLGHVQFRGVLRRPVVAPIAVGLLLIGLFVVGGLVFRTVPFLAGLTEDVIGYARYGILPVVVIITIMNGIAEELFFRGALFAGIGVKHPVTISTILYTLVTVGSGNPVLIFAAALLGTVVALERRASGGVLGPILTHVTWSTSMLFLLPLIFPG